MCIKDYFNWTIETTKHGMKLSGVIFTAIFAVIGVVSGLKEGFTVGSIGLFVLCLLLGNGLGLFIMSLAFFSSYKQCKAVIRFYSSIPDDIRANYGLIMEEKQRNVRNEYPNLTIFDTTHEHPFTVGNYDKYVGITIINDLRKVDDFPKRVPLVNKKYKEKRVELTGWGLRKYIPKKEWKTITNEKINTILEELKLLSIEEALVVVKRNDDETAASDH